MTAFIIKLRSSAFAGLMTLPCSFVLVLLLLVSSEAMAATEILPTTWNIIGLDSNVPTAGPRYFPVGARVCGGTVGTNTTATFHWDGGTDDGTYIKLRPGSGKGPGSEDLLDLTYATDSDGKVCAKAFFEVEVTTSSSAFGQTRGYYITADGLTTPRPRELFVEKLVSQGRNGIDDVQFGAGASPTSFASIPAGGSISMTVGGTYTIKLVGHTATSGYEQLEDFIYFSNTIFQILSVSTQYSANTAPSSQVPTPNPSMYADACGWENDPTNTYYRSCTLGSYKAGGNMTTTYVIKVLSSATSGSTTLNTLIHDFSGSSFHYNSDYSTAARTAIVVNPATSLSFSKGFYPNPTNVTTGSTLSFTINNSAPGSISDLNFSDYLPTSPGAMTVAGTALAGTVDISTTTATVTGTGTSFTTALAPGDIVVVNSNAYVISSITDNTHLVLTATPSSSGSSLTMNRVGSTSCGGAFTTASGGGLTVGSATFKMAGGTVQASGSCTVAVKVATPATGTYTNPLSSNPLNLYFGSTPINPSVTATLTVGTTAPPSPPLSSCANPVVLAKWTFDPTTSTSNPTGTIVAPNTVTTQQILPNSRAIDVSAVSTYATYGSGTGTSGFATSSSDWGGPCSGNGAVPCGNNSDTTTFWGIRGGWGGTSFVPTSSSTPFFQFQVDSSNYGGVGISANYDLEGNWSQADKWYILSSDGSSWNTPNSGTWAKSAWSTAPMTAQATTTGTSTTTFRIEAAGAQKADATMFIDDVVITGCPRIKPPTIVKEFVPAQIVPNGVSTLTFTLTNPNSATPLTGVAFGDTFPISPANMVVASSSPAMGTVNVTNSSATVTGLRFNAQFKANDIIIIAGVPYTVKTVDSDTQLTLTSNYGGATGTGKAITGIASGCGPATINPNPLTGGSLSFSAGTIAAAGTCVVKINVTAPTAGTYPNTSGAVSATGTSGGTISNTANLTVTATHPQITVFKEVATSNTSSTLWSNYLPVAAGTRIYYHLQVQNDGDVDLTNVIPSDTLDSVPYSIPSGCWHDGDGNPLADSGFTLYVSNPNNNRDFATCILGASATINAQSGSHTNTLTATSGASSDTDSATYANPGITLTKSANQSSFVAAGDVLSYSFVVTNSGSAKLPGPITVSDKVTSNGNTSVTVTCPLLNTIGVDPDKNNTFDPGESFTCSASYTVTAADVANGLVTNQASASSAATGSIPSFTSNTASKTVNILQPDITVIKSADKWPAAAPNDIITYTIHVVNSGGQATNVTLTDKVSAYTALRVKYNNSEATPFNFIPNSSGLTLVPGAVISYSSNGTDFNHTLTDQGDGYDSSVTDWKIVFSGTMAAGNISNKDFDLNYQMKVK